MLTIEDAVCYQSARIVRLSSRRGDWFAVAIIYRAPNTVSAFSYSGRRIDARRFSVTFQLIGIKTLYISSMILVAELVSHVCGIYRLTSL
jgi:hypothetical protein